MTTQRAHRMRPFAGAAVLAALLAVTPAAAESETEFTGQVELLYRSVDASGNEELYDEAFDGLDSGARLGTVLLDWQKIDSSFFDYARLALDGFGGEPYQAGSLRIGRKNIYDLSITSRKQDYIYNLFAVADDEDGHSWNTERRMTDIDLTLHTAERWDVLFDYQEVRRTGESLFMKDINRDLFRLDTPIDRDSKNYSGGMRWHSESGRTSFEARQTYRRYGNTFDNSTEGNMGLDPLDPANLTFYDWEQDENGTADFTSVIFNTGFGEHVLLSAAYRGTLFGDEEFTSHVKVNASGTDFTGAPFAWVDGFSETKTTQDFHLFDLDLSVRIIDPVTVHLQYRFVNQNADSNGMLDLQGTGTVTPVSTSFDYMYDIATVLVEVRPIESLTFTPGYRLINRDLERAGFGGMRDGDFESNNDATALFSFDWRPVKMFKLAGDYENGEVDRPFTVPSLYETEGFRVMATVKPAETMTLTLTYRDFENMQTVLGLPLNASLAADPNSFFPTDSTMENTSLSATWSQQVGQYVDYMVSYARQELEGTTEIVFDVSGFGAGAGPQDSGTSSIDNDNDAWLFQINAHGGPWNGYLRYSMADAAGTNPFVGVASGIISTGVLDQQYDDVGAGVTYTFASGLYVGGDLRFVDYEDEGDYLRTVDSDAVPPFSDPLMYDASIFTIRAGLRF